MIMCLHSKLLNKNYGSSHYFCQGEEWGFFDTFLFEKLCPSPYFKQKMLGFPFNPLLFKRIALLDIKTAIFRSKNNTIWIIVCEFSYEGAVLS